LPPVKIAGIDHRTLTNTITNTMNLSPVSRVPRIASRRLPAAFIGMVLLAAAGCRTSAPEPAQPGSPRNALQAHVWQCTDGSAVQTRNIASPPALALRIGNDTRTLPQVRAASGVRYEDAAMVFWTKGDTATLERKPAKTTECREIRAQSLLEDARVRGVTFRGTGNEPGWLLEIGPKNRVMFEDSYGSVRVVFESLSPRTDTQPGVTVIENTSSAYRLRATLQRKTCSDTMSDEIFPYTVEVEIEGAKRRGCGQPLR
jgi:membrane-bound inhibitor of C-type lysozyme